MATANDSFILNTDSAWNGTGLLISQLRGKSFYLNGYTDEDTKESDYIAETATAEYTYDGTYVSDKSHTADTTGADSIAVSAGDTLPEASGKLAYVLGVTKYSITLEDGTVLTQADFDNEQLPIRIIEVTDSNGNKTYPVVIDFYDFQIPQLNGKPPIVKITISENSSSEGYDYIDPEKFDAEYTPVCFTAGTLIMTGEGEKPVETLRPGDLVQTHDRGLQPLLWVGISQVSPATLIANPKIRPIRIRASALAPQVPDRDLLVSPQHRILLKSTIVRRMFDTGTVLAAAKQLLGMPGVEVSNNFFNVTYVHVLLENHEIVQTHGMWSESLYLGKQAQINLTEEQLEEISTIFPDLLKGEIPHQPARMFSKGALARKLVQRSQKNCSVLFDGERPF